MDQQAVDQAWEWVKQRADKIYVRLDYRYYYRANIRRLFTRLADLAEVAFNIFNIFRVDQCRMIVEAAVVCQGNIPREVTMLSWGVE